MFVVVAVVVVAVVVAVVQVNGVVNGDGAVVTVAVVLVH